MLAAVVAANTNRGCKDLEEERGGKGISTDERGGRKVWGLAELATQSFRCCRNTTVVTTVVKSQKLVFEKYFKFYCYYRCICFTTYQLYSSLRTTMSTLSQAQLLRHHILRYGRESNVLTKGVFNRISVQNDTVGKASMYC